MSKTVYKVMSAIVLFALIFGSYSNASASSVSVPQMAVTTYYVSPTGNDANAGIASAPFKTIQRCLNLVMPGDTCQVLSGTYNESLVLKKSGTQSSPIQLIAGGVVTVNSGNTRTLVTSGAIGYYIVDGFRFISTAASSNDAMTATVNFSYNFWGDGDKFERGNDGFVLRNCYIEGAVYFYGSDNLVEYCELNGKGTVWNAITERSQPSENNIFRNNVIHDYYQRAAWSLQMTRNTLWENNSIYNIGHSGNGGAIDCDGAGSAVYGCNVIGNRIYNVPGETAILMENGFDSLVEGNTIHDATRGISVINYNIENGDGFRADKNYKDLVTNTIIRNNVIYNISNDGVLCKAVKGNQLLNNTIYNTKTPTYFGAVALSGYTKVYCPDWIIKGNIVSQSPKTVYLEGNPSISVNGNFYDTFTGTIYGAGNKTFASWQAMGYDLESKTGNPLFVNAAAGNFHLQSGSPACAYGAFPCGGMVPTIAPTLTVTNTPVIISSVSPTLTSTAIATVTPVATITASVSSATPLPASSTPTASAIPASPTTISVQPSTTPTASSVPALPTSTLTQPSVTPTASSVPASPTATASSVPVLPTVTASPVPVLPTATSVQPTATPAPQQSQSTTETVYDDKHSSFVYSADWRDVALAQASGGSFKKTGQDGSSITFTFTGQSFSVIYTSGPAYGQMKVYLDGSLIKTINQNEPTSGYQTRWNYPNQLTLGKHTLKLVAVGNEDRKGSIDAVVVQNNNLIYPNSAVSPAPTASSVPVLPTSTASLVVASPTPTASSVSASPTPIASSIPATSTQTSSPVVASVTPTASSVPASPTATASSVPVLPTVTASPVPVLPTATSVQPTATPAPQQSQSTTETVYDDKHSSFVYSADWRDVALAQASGGSFKKTGQDGSSITFTFTGQSFSVIYTSGPAYGQMKVYLDGSLIKTINQNEPTSGYQTRWNYPNQLTLGKHTLKLVAVGNDSSKGSLDAVIVR